MQFFMNRRVNHARHRHGAGNQADIDSEILAFGNEVARAVERVNEEKMRCQLVGQSSEMPLPRSSVYWGQCGQRALDNVFGVPVSLGYGRFIRFFFCLNAVFIMLHDAGTGFESRGAQGLHKSTFMGVERKRCWGHALCLALARAPHNRLV